MGRVDYSSHCVVKSTSDKSSFKKPSQDEVNVTCIALNSTAHKPKFEEACKNIIIIKGFLEVNRLLRYQRVCHP